MSASVTRQWGPGGVEQAPYFQALAAAQHAAWLAPEERRRAVFVERFRQLVGAERADRVTASALAIFDAQAKPPVGFQDPPANMHFECCPRCQRLSARRFGQAPQGRVKLNALRDREWLERQLSVSTIAGVAERLGCTVATVRLWADKHGVERTRHKQDDDTIAALHDAGLAPGEISEKLEIPVDKIRGALKRTRGVTAHTGHHYHQKSWWVERLVTKQMTSFDCARAAGITTHAAFFWVKKFDLRETTNARSCRTLRRRWKYKYPALADPAQLKALMEQHGSYEQVALAVTGSRNGATNVKIWWLRHFSTPPASVGRGRPGKKVAHSEKSWWTARLREGATTWQLAEELQIKETSVREKLRTLGGDMLAWGYRNNTAAEKKRRQPEAKPWWAKPAVDAVSA